MKKTSILCKLFEEKDLVRIMGAHRAVYAQRLVSKDKDIVFTSGTRNIEGKTNIVGVFHVSDSPRGSRESWGVLSKHVEQVL